MDKKQFLLREDRIILMGDTHSTRVMETLLNKIPEGNEVFHVGDVGLGFGPKLYQKETSINICNNVNEFCKEKNIILYLNRGNHDNPWVWTLPDLSNLKMIQTGDTLIFPNGKRVLCIGGAVSVDRYVRTEGLDYWEDEITPDVDITEKYDIVFSHDTPEFFNHNTQSLMTSFQWYVQRDVTLLDDCGKQRNKIEKILRQSGATKFFSGHYHNSMSSEYENIKYRCIGINELFEVKANE